MYPLLVGENAAGLRDEVVSEPIGEEFVFSVGSAVEHAMIGALLFHEERAPQRERRRSRERGLGAPGD